MRIGVIGLPLSGKTTLFNVLTGSQVETSSFSGGRQSHLGTVKVPDARLDFIHQSYPEHKKIQTIVEYVDVVGIAKGATRSVTILDELLNQLRNCEALLLVVRDFANDRVPHPEGKINPQQDVQIVETELLLSDLAILETRINRLQKEIAKRKDAKDEKELLVLEKCRGFVENEKPLRELELTEEENKLIRGYQFLSAKPLLIVLNIGEEHIGQEEQRLQILQSYTNRPRTRIAALSAEIEMEISQLEAADAAIFRQDLGIKEVAVEKLIRESYALLGLISFFTIGTNEVRAWTIRQGTTAQKAAGVVHTDMERGFIRAEVVHFNDYQKYGSISKVREMAALHLEGKDYVIHDGDIVFFRFHV